MASKALVMLLLALVATTATALSCPAVQTPLYNYPATPCPRVDKCLTLACSCIGGTFDNVTRVCPALQTIGDCSTFSTCARQLIKCFNEEAELATAAAECTEWAHPIYNALLEATATDAFVNTTLYAACTHEVCLIANMTSRCMPDYGATCVAPPRFYGTLRLSGDWAAIIAVPSQKETVINSVDADLTAQLGTDVSIFDVRSGSLIVEFALQEFGAAIEDKLAAAANSSTWLGNTRTAYATFGGEGNVTVLYAGPTVTEAPAPTNSTKPGDDESSCSSGCVAGIIVGIVVFVVIVGAVVFVRGRKTEEDEELSAGSYGKTKYSSV